MSIGESVSLHGSCFKILTQVGVICSSGCNLISWFFVQKTPYLYEYKINEECDESIYGVRNFNNLGYGRSFNWTLCLMRTFKFLKTK